ncbi:ERF family protein [Sphingomonas sp. 1P08PE]|uniref:ERF family protein n=1 Tax=Sphingomonas sp. 1P08PE TaxID=554122 RepID=UPI00399F4F3C
MKVYQAIAAVQGEMARDGIGKDRRNSQQGYNFRGIDDVFNALSPLLSKHGLCILPRCIERSQVERTSAKGGALFYTTVDVEFDFVAAEDGSKHTIRVPGEAMDSADKSTNKAMSAAYKYAAMQAFCIPTEGDNDADATTHDVAPRQQPRHDPVKPEAKITDEQRQQMMDLATAKNIDAREICETGKIPSVKDLPAARFKRLMDWLAMQPKRELAPAGGQASADLDDEIPY